MRRKSLAGDQPVVSGEQRELEPRRNAELVVDIGEVMLDGVFADRKPLGHFAVAEAGNHVRDNSKLPRRQPKRVGMTSAAIATRAAGEATAAISH